MNTPKRTARRAFTLIELLAALASGAILLSCCVVAQDEKIDRAAVTRSMENLKKLGIAHHTYAKEWNGRQLTTCPDDLSAILRDRFKGEYPKSYNDAADQVPAVPIGFSKDGTFYEARNAYLIQPLFYSENCSLGAFRAWNMQPFNAYLDGRVYDKSYWAPDDYTMPDAVKEYFEDPGQWPGPGTPFYHPTYCLSAAAMFHPEVFRPKSEGGFQDPRELPNGFRAPALGQARYPDLKTHMLEHYWLRDRPSDAIPDSNGVPWFFNLGAKSAPITLFYDGHIEELSVRRVLDSNKRIVEQEADPLWVEKETSCFSGGGYFDDYAQNADERTSFHVFTAGGILGRDALNPE